MLVMMIGSRQERTPAVIALDAGVDATAAIHWTWVPGIGAIPQDCVIRVQPGEPITPNGSKCHPELARAPYKGSGGSTGHTWMLALQMNYGGPYEPGHSLTPPGTYWNDDAGNGYLHSTQVTITVPPVGTILDSSLPSVSYALFPSFTSAALTDDSGVPLTDVGIYGQNGILQPVLAWNWDSLDGGLPDPTFWTLGNYLVFTGASYVYYQFSGTANPGDQLTLSLGLDQSKYCNNTGYGCSYISAIQKNDAAIGFNYLEVTTPVKFTLLDSLVLEVNSITSCLEYPASPITAQTKFIYQNGEPWTQPVPIALWRNNNAYYVGTAGPGPNCPYNIAVDGGFVTFTMR